MLLGDKTELSRDIEHTFRDLGLSHLLVVSGFHIGLIFLSFRQAVRFLLRRFSFLKTHISLNSITNILGLLFVLIFCIISGFKPSALRAFIAILTLSFYEKLGFKPKIFHLLSIYLLIFILFSSSLMYELGVQYTFLALLGIGIGSSIYTENKFLNCLAVTFFATATTSILTLFVFKEFSVISYITNFILSPILIIVVCKAGLILIILSEINFNIALKFSYIIEFLSYYLIEFLKTFSKNYKIILGYPSIVSYIYILFLLTIIFLATLYLFKQYKLKYNLK